MKVEGFHGIFAIFYPMCVVVNDELMPRLWLDEGV